MDAKRKERLERLVSNYNKHNKYGKEPRDIFERLAWELSRLPFMDCLVQTYKCRWAEDDPEELNVIFNLWFDDEIEAAVEGCCEHLEDEPWDSVVFSIWSGKKLLVSDFMAIEDFVDRMLSVEHIQEMFEK